MRAAARELLSALPGSAYTRRAVERAAPLLRVEPRTVRRDWLVASLPEVTDEAAVRDGIVARPPGSGIGAQAWLLTQLIAAVPLAEWVARFGRDEAAIVALPVSGGLGSDVRAGWRRAAVRQGSQPWAKAILSVGEPGTVSARPAVAWTSDDRLAEILPPGWRAERAVALLAGSAPDTAAVTEVARCPGPWPDSLAAAVMAALSRAAGSATRQYWPDQLAAAGRPPPAGHRRARWHRLRRRPGAAGGAREVPDLPGGCAAPGRRGHPAPALVRHPDPLTASLCACLKEIR